MIVCIMLENKRCFSSMKDPLSMIMSERRDTLLMRISILVGTFWLVMYLLYLIEFS